MVRLATGTENGCCALRNTELAEQRRSGRWSTLQYALLNENATERADEALPIDLLSSCMFWFAPLPYRSATIRRLYSTTKAAVKLARFANAASTAWRS